MQRNRSAVAADAALPWIRPPDEVMKLDRMGCAHPTRLSFLRQLLRRVEREQWQFSRSVWRLDDRGVGVAVYQVRTPHRIYSLVAFAHDLPDELRSDRVIATAWDATFTLFDGVPSAADLARLQANVPLQEAGRISDTELTLSRANRSARLFEHVVQSLARGVQPDVAEIDRVGYLMRTSAVYGSGKFGACDRERIKDRPELASPFQAEMLTVWLIREFTFDIVDHLAMVRGGASAVRLAPSIRKWLGVGNSTGLGMVQFLIHHPALLSNWMLARETALARVRALPAASACCVAGFRSALADMIENARTWHSAHPLQQPKIQQLREDLIRISGWLADWQPGRQAYPWNALWVRGQQALSLEGQEALVALLIEPHGDLVDDLADDMSVDEAALPSLDGNCSLRQMRALLEAHYAWALNIDFGQENNQAYFWYTSQEKLEPRLGHRYAESGSAREKPFDIAKRARLLHEALLHEPADAPLAGFLLAHPEHRYIAQRVQLVCAFPYAEIRDNLIAGDVLPIDMMRCKLAFFGASHFDPRSDKWVRISLFHGKPPLAGLNLAQEG